MRSERLTRRKAGTWFGEKVELDGYKFDSQKEAKFYEKFIKNSGFKYEVHKRFQLFPMFELLNGALRIRSISYTPDFVLYDDDGNLKHVIDVKNSFTSFAIDVAAAMRFKLFAYVYKVPVEVVVPKAHSFRVKITGTTKKFNPVEKTDFVYSVERLCQEAIK